MLPNFTKLSISYLSKVSLIRSEQITKLKIFPFDFNSTRSYLNFELKQIALLLGMVHGVVVQDVIKVFSEVISLKTSLS